MKKTLLPILATSISLGTILYPLPLYAQGGEFGQLCPGTSSISGSTGSIDVNETEFKIKLTFDGTYRASTIPGQWHPNFTVELIDPSNIQSCLAFNPGNLPNAITSRGYSNASQAKEFFYKSREGSLISENYDATSAASNAQKVIKERYIANKEITKANKKIAAIKKKHQSGKTTTEDSNKLIAEQNAIITKHSNTLKTAQITEMASGIIVWLTINDKPISGSNITKAANKLKEYEKLFGGLVFDAVYAHEKNHYDMYVKYPYWGMEPASNNIDSEKWKESHDNLLFLSEGSAENEALKEYAAQLSRNSRLREAINFYHLYNTIDKSKLSFTYNDDYEIEGDITSEVQRCTQAAKSLSAEEMAKYLIYLGNNASIKDLNRTYRQALENYQRLSNGEAEFVREYEKHKKNIIDYISNSWADRISVESNTIPTDIIPPKEFVLRDDTTSVVIKEDIDIISNFRKLYSLISRANSILKRNAKSGTASSSDMRALNEIAEQIALVQKANRPAVQSMSASDQALVMNFMKSEEYKVMKETTAAFLIYCISIASNAKDENFRATVEKLGQAAMGR